MKASVAVLVGEFLMYFFNWYWVEQRLTIVIAIYLIIVGLKLLKEDLQMLMLFTGRNVDVKQ
jgi:cobalt-zinc-cadmium efflux system protein